MVNVRLFCFLDTYSPAYPPQYSPTPSAEVGEDGYETPDSPGSHGDWQEEMTDETTEDESEDESISLSDAYPDEHYPDGLFPDVGLVQKMHSYDRKKAIYHIEDWLLHPKMRDMDPRIEFALGRNGSIRLTMYSKAVL